jgi:hypothetical protein
VEISCDIDIIDRDKTCFTDRKFAANDFADLALK